MLPLNFYKIRTGIDIRPRNQGGTFESELRYEQIIQVVTQKAELEFLYPSILVVEEFNPSDLPFYNDKKIPLYVFIFAVNKNTSSWSASALKQALGNMKLSKRILDINNSAKMWIGGVKANISCEAANFDLRAKKRNKY